MVEAQTWTTRRMSSPRLLETMTTEQVLDISATSLGDVRNNAYSFGSSFSPIMLTALIIASWYLSNIGVLLLNKYFLSFHDYRCLIFLIMLHMLSCAAYSEYFQNKLVDAIHFMEVLSLKDSVEKDTFFRGLPNLAEQLPRQIVLKKLLPLLAFALEFGSAVGLPFATLAVSSQF